jgi:hypothetical protein
MTIQPAPDKNTPAKLNHKSVMSKEFRKNGQVCEEQG